MCKLAQSTSKEAFIRRFTVVVNCSTRTKHLATRCQCASKVSFTTLWRSMKFHLKICFSASAVSWLTFLQTTWSFRLVFKNWRGRTVLRVGIGAAGPKKLEVEPHHGILSGSFLLSRKQVSVQQLRNVLINALLLCPCPISFLHPLTLIHAFNWLSLCHSTIIPLSHTISSTSN